VDLTLETSDAIAGTAPIPLSSRTPTSDNGRGGGAGTRGPQSRLEQAWMPMSSNERQTENLVRADFRRLHYYDESGDIRVEEQKSEIEAVKKLLRSASKSCGGGKGSPEFIVSSPSNADFLLIVECKANPRDHESPDFGGRLLTPLPALRGGRRAPLRPAPFPRIQRHRGGRKR
jgi:hypothetical protein